MACAEAPQYTADFVSKGFLVHSTGVVMVFAKKHTNQLHKVLAHRGAITVKQLVATIRNRQRDDGGWTESLVRHDSRKRQSRRVHATLLRPKSIMQRARNTAQANTFHASRACNRAQAKAFHSTSSRPRAVQPLGKSAATLCMPSTLEGG